MSGGSFDFREVERMRRQLERLEQERGRFCEECAKELAARFLTKVKKRTPVGQYPNGSGQLGGTLRRGWTIGDIQKQGDQYTIEVINPTEYASYVEYGHRTANHTGWVPGHFMLTISESQLQAQAPALLEQKLAELVRRAFDA